eukprot:g23505.t1
MTPPQGQFQHFQTGRRKQLLDDDLRGLEDDDEQEQSLKTKYIKLISKEGYEVLCDKKAASVSATIKTMLASEAGPSSSDGLVSVRFDSISGKTLEQVVQYFHYIDRHTG